MPIAKKSDGWYWGSKGPFKSKAKALQVAQAAHASGFKEESKRPLTFGLDFDNTYSIDPEFWNKFIDTAHAKGYVVLCITQEDSDSQAQYDKVTSTIGKVIGDKNCYFTAGKAKMDYCDKHDIVIDIWIDNNPKRIFKDK